MYSVLCVSIRIKQKNNILVVTDYLLSHAVQVSFSLVKILVSQFSISHIHSTF